MWRRHWAYWHSQSSHSPFRSPARQEGVSRYSMTAVDTIRSWHALQAAAAQWSTTRTCIGCQPLHRPSHWPIDSAIPRLTGGHSLQFAVPFRPQSPPSWSSHFLPQVHWCWEALQHCGFWGPSLPPSLLHWPWRRRAGSGSARARLAVRVSCWIVQRQSAASVMESTGVSSRMCRG